VIHLCRASEEDGLNPLTIAASSLMFTQDALRNGKSRPSLLFSIGNILDTQGYSRHPAQSTLKDLSIYMYVFKLKVSVTVLDAF
jgi:hypothetical protein